MSKLHFQPIKGQAREILTAILKSPEVASCNLKVVLLLRLACEEIVMNITSYAYPEGCASREQNGACSDSAEAQPALAEGKSDDFLDVEIDKKSDRIVIRFEDGGKPFNPLKQKKPDTNLSWRKRRIGGLGIFLVRRKMDDVRYVYKNGKNVLTIEKVI